MRRAVIFGADGQDGHYLSEFLLGAGYAVWKSSVDVTDQDAVTTVISRAKQPDEVYNLAAVMDGPEAYRVAVVGAVNCVTLAPPVCKTAATMGQPSTTLLSPVKNWISTNAAKARDRRGMAWRCSHQASANSAGITAYAASRWV